jgi:hypothetical protein
VFRKVFVQYGPFVCRKSAKGVRAMWTTDSYKGAKYVLKRYVCKQQQEREQRSLLKLVELKRTSRSGKGVLRANVASMFYE